METILNFWGKSPWNTCAYESVRKDPPKPEIQAERRTVYTKARDTRDSLGRV